MNSRLKDLRAELGLTLEEFGKRVGITRSAVGRIEKGERALTEQMTLLICKEFHVNYFWLTQGKGEMFVDTPQTVIDEIAEEYVLDELDKRILEKYLALKPQEREIIKRYLKSIFT